MDLIILKKTKKKFILEGLDCTNCANKIELSVSKINGVTSAIMDLATKTLTIEIDDQKSISDVVSEINDIIRKLEHPNVQVKAISKPTKKVLLLVGLKCANCSTKIETRIKNIPGVKSATIDFVSKKLTIEVSNKNILDNITNKVSKIAQQIEPGLKVINEENQEELERNECANKGVFCQIIIGAALFFIALLFKFPFWIEFSIFFASYILIGSKVIFQAIKNILRGQVFDENFLMCIATIGAFAIKEFPEGIAVMLFYRVGEFLQEIAVNRSRKSISALMDIRPDFANLKTNDNVKKVPPHEVQLGDIIIIKPGEKVPLDGNVIEGKSMIDTSALTGESVPREVEPGNDILSGSINKNGLLLVKVTKTFGESTVSKILDLVQNASSKKAPTENFITKFARYYTPIVVFAAIILAIIPPLVVPGASFQDWLNRALIFLVVSCPCALVISIPLGFFGGIGGASKNGILVKGGNYLEALSKVDTVVFDKTGTLTKGVFKVTQIVTTNSMSDADLLEYAAYAESYSTHPIAISIQDAYHKEIEKNRLSDYNEIPGHGIKVNIDGKNILIGNSRLMEKENINFEKTQNIGTVIHVAIDSNYAGFIVISDELKDDSKKAIGLLRNLGVKKLVMLTGDSKDTSEEISKSLGLDEVYSELLPDQKVEKVELLYKQKLSNGRLVFVGDGINDTPVLARADIGIAMGGIGSDAAIEAADVVLMTDEPSKVVSAIKIARRTHNIVWQNIAFAMSVKVIVLLLGTKGIATMWEAVFADIGVTILAVLNAMRIITYNTSTS